MQTSLGALTPSALDIVDPNNTRTRSLLDDWVRTPTHTLGEYLARARTAFHFELLDVFRSAQDLTAVSYSQDSHIESYPGSPTALRSHHPSHEASAAVQGTLLEAMWPLCTATAGCFPRTRGEHLLPWLVLGGYQHRLTGQARKFIQAAQAVFGANMIRGYRQEVNARMTSPILSQIIQQSLDQMATPTTALLPELDLLEVVQRANLLQGGGLPPELGWELFLEQARLTRRLVVDQASIPARPHELPAQPNFVELVDWLASRGSQPTTRETVSWVSDRLVVAFASGQLDEHFLRSL